jgi:hypothetical protein
MKKNARASWIQAVVVVSLLAVSATAQTPRLIYDNSENPLNAYFASQTEFGDQIDLQGGGWIADSFRFEYFAAGLGGGETAFIRFYANNGVPFGEAGAQAPGELLYQSPSFPLHSGNIPVDILDLAPLNIQLPNSFTWTILTSGVGPGEIFGLNLYDPPVNNPPYTLGTSLNDIWQFSASGWQLVQIDDLPPGASANFGATLTAVPEPGPISLLALGALALLLRRKGANA